MPLFKGKKNINRNIKKEISLGRPRKQAIAIATNVARKPKNVTGWKPTKIRKK